jgi:DnaK suppressor protein
MQVLKIETNFGYLHMKAKKTEILIDYLPSTDEKYMNKQQLNYFKDVLETWRFQTQANLSDVEKRLAELNASDEHDEMDRAFIETEVSITINKISALQNLLNDIDVSLNDIEFGNYGYCRKNGKEIGIKRLLAKPTSRFAIKAQEDTEKEERMKRKFEDEEEASEEAEEID